MSEELPQELENIDLDVAQEKLNQEEEDKEVEYFIDLGDESIELPHDPSNIRARHVILEMNALLKKNRLIRAREAKWVRDFQEASSKIIYKDDDWSDFDYHLVKNYEIEEPEYEWKEKEVKEKYKDEDGKEKERVKVDEDGVPVTKMVKGKKISDTKWINDEYFILWERPSLIDKGVFFYIPELLPQVLDRYNYLISIFAIDDEKIAGKNDKGKKEISKYEKYVEENLRFNQMFKNLWVIGSWLIAKGFAQGTPLADFSKYFDVSDEDKARLVKAAQDAINQHAGDKKAAEASQEEEDKKKA